MARPVPTGVPSELPAGTTWKFTLPLADFPPSEGWAVTLVFRGASAPPAAGVTVTPQVETSDYLVVVPVATTSGITAGTYQWTAYAEKVGEKYEADSGTLVVTPDAAAATDGALQSHAERMVPLLEQALERRVPVDMKTYTIVNRSATHEELGELRQLLAHYRTEVARQQNGGRLPSIEVVFGRA